MVHLEQTNAFRNARQRVDTLLSCVRVVADEPVKLAGMFAVLEDALQDARRAAEDIADPRAARRARVEYMRDVQRVRHLRRLHKPAA